MPDFVDAIYLQDMAARRAVDDRLYFIQAGVEHLQQQTTESVVFARDPLQPISKVLDSLKVIPSVPATNSIAITAGWFYCNGLLYAFPGSPNLAIHLSPDVTTTIFVGLKVNRTYHTVESYVNTEHGAMPSILPDVLPLALVQVRADATQILSDDIVDIRPFLHYDVSPPADKREVYIPCLGPMEGISFDRKPYHTGAPQLQVWQKLGTTLSNYKVVHSYKKPVDYNEVESGEFIPFTPLYNGANLEYSQVYDGMRLKKIVTRNPVELFNRDADTVFVDPNGSDSWPGTKARPVMTLDQAISVVAVKPEITTIYLNTGVYVSTTPKLLNRAVTILGRDPESVILRMAGNGYIRVDGSDTTGTLRFQTVCLQFSGQIATPPADASNMWIRANRLAYYNCVFRIVSEAYACATLTLGYAYMFFTNCIFHNPYPLLGSTARIYPDEVLNFNGVQNCVYIGDWVTTKIVSSNNIDSALVDPKLENIPQFKYRPVYNSPCINAGTYNEVVADIDGSFPDIGLYGGQFASLADYAVYPLNKLAVFKYPLQSLFAPVLAKFASIAIEADIPTDTQIYGAVSFNGGKVWLTWNEGKAAWVAIELSQLVSSGNTMNYLRTKLQQIDLTEYHGEIILAIGLYTQDANKSPGVKTVTFTCDLSKDSLTPYPMDVLDVFVDDEAVYIRNRLDVQVRDLVVVVR